MMRTITKLLSVTAIAGSLAAMTAPAGAADMIGEGVTVYMQMGGQPGEPPVLPRTNGAKAAAEALGVKLIEQYSSWQAETMLAQFREALAVPTVLAILAADGVEVVAGTAADVERLLRVEARRMRELPLS